MSGPRLHAQQLTRAWGDRVAIREVDLSVGAGEVLGVIGPNGGGKSTLLLLLAGLIDPTSGEVRIDGLPARELAVRRAGTVGLITAEPGLYPLLTGRENLRFFGGLHGRSPGDVDARTAALLEELGVTGEIDARASTYSSGTLQKVSLARALLLHPRVLLLDEPTSHLDPLSSHAMHRAIRQQADQGVTVVLVTHDLHAAEQICDRVAGLNQWIRRIDVVGPSRAPTRSRLADLFEVTESPPT